MPAPVQNPFKSRPVTSQPGPRGALPWVRLRVAPGGRLSNLEEQHANPDPPGAAEVGRKMAAASVSETSASQFSSAFGPESHSILGSGGGRLDRPLLPRRPLLLCQGCTLPLRQAGPVTPHLLLSSFGLAAQIAERCLDSQG
ncbi:hypothetical protein J1605_001625 [Eschrichtius robustus]|uniref:Uncharacterized protein n=1 Tax=Eschrichtius robustus TaxID=9764 RepID=A0AB34I3I9_ESCRO|nr:hypothetical protein J1605_001625 [Eschrichtius robustus]